MYLFKFLYYLNANYFQSYQTFKISDFSMGNAILKTISFDGNAEIWSKLPANHSIPIFLKKVY